MTLRFHWLLFATVLWTACARSEEAKNARGRQFIAITSFDSFIRSSDSTTGETFLTSPKLRSDILFNELVVSWNDETPPGGYLVVEARALYGESATKYYQMGVWSADTSKHARQSVAGQQDQEGDVRTDTLFLQRPAQDLQVRLRVGGAATAGASLRFVGISLADTTVHQKVLPPDRSAWDKVLPVPERTQMIYPNGKTLCSPTTVSMLMGFWAAKLKRPELDHTVPEIAAAIYDSQWQGTGNWPFNMAYAGSFPSMRAYVTRLSDVSEIEQWIAQGIPVGLSVDYDRLRAKGPGPNGHLVVCVGFTKTGDPIINDPGTSQHVQKIFPRSNLVDAWGCSKNTVYLVYPEGASLPDDRFGHWDSATSRNWKIKPALKIQ